MGENVGKQTMFTMKVEQVETFEEPVLQGIGAFVAFAFHLLNGFFKKVDFGGERFQFGSVTLAQTTEFGFLELAFLDECGFLLGCERLRLPDSLALGLCFRDF